MTKKIISVVLLMSMIFPFFRADAFSIWKSGTEKCKIYDTETNKTDAVKLFEAAENLGLANGTLNEIIYELSRKVKEIEEAEKVCKYQINILQKCFKKFGDMFSKELKIYLCVGIVIGLVLGDPDFQFFSVIAREINLCLLRFFFMEQLSRRVESLENNYDYLSEQITNLVDRLA